MSRIAFFCIPAWGHTNPTVEVVRALTEQGHQVRYYSFAPFREKLEKKLLGEGYEEEVVKSLIGGLMPGILVSYRNDTLGGFGKEIVESLK